MKLPEIIHALARWLAIAGGLVLTAMMAMTIVSISGRMMIPLGLGPVPGDFELVEAGTALCVFAFLPWCQLKRSHATVDLFTSRLSPTFNRIIDLVSETLMATAIILVTWRLWGGLADKIAFGETTFILQFPVWWGFAACAAATIIGVIVAVYMVAIRACEVICGRALLGERQDIAH